MVKWISLGVQHTFFHDFCLMFVDAFVFVDLLRSVAVLDLFISVVVVGFFVSLCCLAIFVSVVFVDVVV